MKKNANIIMIKLFKLNPNFYSFLGGVFIAAAVNFYTSVYAVDIRPSNWKIIILASILTFISSAFLTVISWNLEMVNRLTYTSPDKMVDYEVLWAKLIDLRFVRLCLYLILSFITGISGLFVLQIR